MIPLTPIRNLNVVKLGDYLAENYDISENPVTGKRTYTLKKK